MQTEYLNDERIDCLDLIRSRLPALKGTARTIGTQVLARAWDLRGLTIQELAAEIGTSENAIMRFCQALGYTGYREFSHELALSLGQAAPKALSIPSEALPPPPGDATASTIVRRMIELEGQCLYVTMQHLSDVLIERAVNALHQAETVAFGAFGLAGPIGQLACLRLQVCGLRCLWSADPYTALANAGTLRRGDAAFAVTYSGASRLTVEFLQFARDKGATTIALTAVPGSPITRVADVAFAVFGPDVDLSPGLQRFGSRVSGMALVEALVSALAVKRFGLDPPQVSDTRARIELTLEPATADRPAPSAAQRQLREGVGNA